MRKAMIVLAVAAATGMAVQTASAQTSATKPVLFGVEGNWGTDTDFGVGGRAVWTGLGDAISLKGLEGVASFDIFFPGNSVNYWELNANVTYPLTIPSAPKISPYFGGGLNFAHASVSGVTGSGSTDVGANLLGGLKFRLGTLSAFGEGRLELHSGSQFVLTFGILF